MLPSTGYFKSINCPFYDNGYCERPYCHFRHSRRDGSSTYNVVSTESNQTAQKSQNTATSTVTTSNSDVIQQLVSEAVKKVLADQNVTDTENIVNKVVEGLKPKLALSAAPTVNQEILSQDSAIGKHLNPPVIPTATSSSSCVYNPTPIAELKKRHIPITAYEPTRESKAVKRKSPEVERPWMDVIRNINSTKETKVSYTPTVISQTISSEKKSIHDYIPTIRSDASSNLYDVNSSSNDSYIPEKRRKKEIYCPKPKKRREEYVPRKPKVPLKTKHLEDESIDVFQEILGNTESNPSVIVDEETQDMMEIEPKFSDDDDDNIAPVIDTTKDVEQIEDIVKKTSLDESDNTKNIKIIEVGKESEDKCCTQSTSEKSSKHEETSNQIKEDSPKSKSKSEKSSKSDSKQSKYKDKDSSKHKIKDDSKHNSRKDNDSKHSKSKEGDIKYNKNKEDSKHSKSKEEDSRHSKSKEEDSKHSKSKEEDSKHSKSKEEDLKHSKSKEEDSKHNKSKEEDSKHSRSKEEESKHSKSKEEDSKHSKSREEDSKHSKSKEEDSKQSKNKEEDSKHSKSKEEDSKNSKNKEEDSHMQSGKSKVKEDKKEREKVKEKNKEKDRHKHSSKNSEKEKFSSTSCTKGSKEKDKIKDDENKISSSDQIKKDSKSDKLKRSNSRDSKDNKKDSKDKSRHKSDDKDKHKSKSSSSSSKNKSNKDSVTNKHKNSDRHGSRSSHKYNKSDHKFIDTDNDQDDEKSDADDKCNSPEYEEFSPFYDEHLLEMSDSDHDVEEECRKIFQEYEVTDHPKDIINKATSKSETEESEDVSKKRVAHPSAVSNTVKQIGPTQPPKRLSNPQQRMYERWRMMKEIAAEKAAEKAAASKAFLNDRHVNGNGRLRIAQVPYAMSLELQKQKVLELASKAESKTVAQNKKGGSRVAHIPQMVPQLIRPEPLQNSNTQKFPLNVRQFYLNAMQDICVQIYTDADDAAQRAIREEFACHEKCKAVNVYKNSCMLTIHRLRKEVDQKPKESTSSVSGIISHESVLAGKSKGSWSVIKPRKLTTTFKGVSLYNMLTKWIMTEQELKDNGFPRPHPDGPKGRAKLYVANLRGQSNISKVPKQRFCCRCNKPYMVDKEGFPMRKENCIYHYARKFTFRGESKYMCCKQDGSSDGCCDASTHVWDFIDIENLRGYVSTFDKGNISIEEQGAFALDCEMCYTTQGLELTRITVINEECNVVYETLVKPTHPIIDYNTRFSGITENDMKNVTTTLLDVQATLLSMFSSKTILIGHSLESDFKALKLIHDTVVDTSIMFPHKNGPPFKRALKTLCSEYLRIIIQNELGGHDSKEDAAACMQLVLWKVKEEAKLQ